ncbi:MAG: hypothetical protein JRC90_02910 [Deltaproteobacteria bacterium]|nr:hypothetical protein [Deltaproteobacteria bacterium]
MVGLYAQLHSCSTMMPGPGCSPRTFPVFMGKDKIPGTEIIRNKGKDARAYPAYAYA